MEGAKEGNIITLGEAKPKKNNTNLAKYYRRLFCFIEMWARRARRLSEYNLHVPEAICLNKIYDDPRRKHQSKSESKHHRRSGYRLVVNDHDDFAFEFFPRSSCTSNFLSYIDRCDRIFRIKDFARQPRKEDQIIAQAMRRKSCN